MLPGLGFSEILVLGVIALLVVGPKDLPVMLRQLGQWTRKLQAMAQEFRQGFDELARQAELDELRREVDAMRRTAETGIASVVTAPIADLQADVDALMAPPSSPEEGSPGAALESPPDSLPESLPAPQTEQPQQTTLALPQALPAEEPEPSQALTAR